MLAVLGGLLVFMAIGIPVFLSFLLVNIIGLYLLCGSAGIMDVIIAYPSELCLFILLPVPLFILMGEFLFRSQLAPFMMDAMDKWMGRVPGRLSLLAVASGTLLATLTGVSTASIAILGSVLVPEMAKRGYKKSMILGPIVGSGALAPMIPPSGFGVLIAVVAEASIGKLLIAIIMPGLLMAAIFAAYIIIRCNLQPTLAPPYDVAHIPLSEKLVDTAKYILPVGFIIFLVTGVILLGIATPSEAAATGAFGCLILAAAHKKLNWEMLRNSISSSLEITVMIFMIIGSALAYGQLLARSGAGEAFINSLLELSVAPIVIVIIMQFVILFLGLALSAVSVIMITIPMFMPVCNALGFDPVWVCVISLINVQLALASPPFATDLFVMKSVAPPGTTLMDVTISAVPFTILTLVAVALIMAFPQIVLWLPSLMIR